MTIPGNRKSYGPDLDFTESEVLFDRSQLAQQDDSDDEDSDDGLFAVPIASKKPKQNVSVGRDDPGSDSDRTSKPPNLKVDTKSKKVVSFGGAPSFKSAQTSTSEAPMHMPDMDEENVTSARSGKRPQRRTPASAASEGWSAESSEDTSKLLRRESFAREDVWASRPPPEALINHLDDFFPNLDLDQPVVEEGQGTSPPPSPTHPVDSLATASTLNRNNVETAYDFDDESDAEAVAGLEAMRLAEEQDARRGGGAFGIYDSAPWKTQAQNDLNTSSDSDYANIDMGLYGGGYDARMSYGNDLTEINAGNSSEMDDQSRPLPTPNELHRSEAGHIPVPGLGGMTDYSIPGDSSIHPFPALEQAARVDTYGTGGFQRPTSQGHRLSFDEGDEGASFTSRYSESRLSRISGSDSPSKDDFPEMFYHPGMSSSSQRPLPAVPSSYDNRASQLQPAGSYLNNQYASPYGSNIETRTGYAPDGPDAYPSPDLLNPTGQFVPRSASWSSYSNTPQVIPPVRSRTDGDTLRCCPAVSCSSLVQTSKSERLWSLAFMSLNDAQPDVLQSLNSVLSSELGFDLLYAPGSKTALSNLIPRILNTFSSDRDLGPELEDANEIRKSIIKVIEAVSGTLGLENSAIAWWCVTKLLKVRTTVFKPPTPHPQQYLTNYRHTKPASTHLLPRPPTKSNQSTSPPS